MYVYKCPLLGEAGDLVTKHMKKARHFAALGFFGCKVWPPGFLSLLAKIVWQWNINHRRGRSGEYLNSRDQCNCEATVVFVRSCQAWEVSDDWKRKMSHPYSERARGRFWGYQAHQSNLSPRENYRAYPHGSNLQAHKGQEGDWEHPAWIYQTQIMPD